MKCNHCGKIIPENLIYCPYCGTQIKNTTEPKKNSEIQKRAEDSVILYEKKHRTHTALILICFSLFVVFLLISVLLFLSANGKIGKNTTVRKAETKFTEITVKEKLITVAEASSEENETEDNTDYYTYPAE